MLFNFFSFQVTERPPLVGQPTNTTTPKLFCPYSSTGKNKSYILYYILYYTLLYYKDTI